MNNFGITRNNRNMVTRQLDVELPDAPFVIEGAEALKQLCPVSSLTGNRMSLYEAMQMVGNEKYSRAVEQLLPELPTLMSDSRLSDDDRVATLAARLATGLPSEDDRVRESLSKIVSDFGDLVKANSAVNKDTIQFDPSDTPNPSADA